MEVTLMKKTEELAAELAQNVTTLEELNAMMRSLMTSTMERMLNTEMDVHLGRRTVATSTPSAEEHDSSEVRSPDLPAKMRNRHNGTSPRTIQGDVGKLPISVPRDRDGSFEPLLIARHQRRLTGFPEAIQTVYPQTRVHLCIVHLVRAALKYVVDADSREVARDLRNICLAATVPEAEFDV